MFSDNVTSLAFNNLDWLELLIEKLPVARLILWCVKIDLSGGENEFLQEI